MKLPGRAWLQFEVDPDGDGGSTITQTAIFDPAGVGGLAYWYSLWPIHDYIFRGMLERITAAGHGLRAPSVSPRVASRNADDAVMPRPGVSLPRAVGRYR